MVNGVTTGPLGILQTTVLRDCQGVGTECPGCDDNGVERRDGSADEMHKATYRFKVVSLYRSNDNKKLNCYIQAQLGCGCNLTKVLQLTQSSSIMCYRLSLQLKQTCPACAVMFLGDFRKRVGQKCSVALA
jgi:hypothetical protein